MREILFRGKRLDYGNWAYGYYLFSGLKHYIADNSIAMYCESRETVDNLLEVDPGTVGQFTGLLDKNGKKIFEGDIITFDEQYVIDGRDTHLRLIYWNDGRFNWVQPETKESLSGWTFCQSNAKLHAEIIGNIYENKDLLK